MGWESRSAAEGLRGSAMAKGGAHGERARAPAVQQHRPHRPRPRSHCDVVLRAIPHHEDFTWRCAPRPADVHERLRVGLVRGELAGERGAEGLQRPWGAGGAIWGAEAGVSARSSSGGGSTTTDAPALSIPPSEFHTPVELVEIIHGPRHVPGHEAAAEAALLRIRGQGG